MSAQTGLALPVLGGAKPNQFVQTSGKLLKGRTAPFPSNTLHRLGPFSGRKNRLFEPAILDHDNDHDNVELSVKIKYHIFRPRPWWWPEYLISK